MANYVSELIAIGASFYDVDANGGEGILTNPTTPKVAIFDGNGVQVAGSPFAMVALAVPITGLRVYGWTPGAPGQYHYVCYDSAEPTPTITHSQGDLKVEINDLDLLAGAGFATATDSLDAASTKLDTLTTNLATAQTDLTTIKGYTDTLEASATTIAAYVDTVEGTLATLVGYGAPPSANAIADQVWDEVASGHVTVGTMGYIESVKRGPGAGGTVVNKDTGGSNTLRPEVSGVAQEGVRIEAFLTSDWTAGNRNYATYGKGSSVSDSSGDFTLILSAGSYTLNYYRIRSGATSGLTATTTTVTVS